jgi:hypothetical protein
MRQNVTPKSPQRGLARTDNPGSHIAKKIEID